MFWPHHLFADRNINSSIHSIIAIYLFLQPDANHFKMRSDPKPDRPAVETKKKHLDYPFNTLRYTSRPNIYWFEDLFLLTAKLSPTILSWLLMNFESLFWSKRQSTDPSVKTLIYKAVSVCEGSMISLTRACTCSMQLLWIDVEALNCSIKEGFVLTWQTHTPTHNSYLSANGFNVCTLSVTKAFVHSLNWPTPCPCVCVSVNMFVPASLLWFDFIRV